MPTASKQHPPSVKKVALRDLHNETRSVVARPQGTSLTKQRRPFSEAVNVSGAKRHHPDCPPSPRHQSESSAAANRELVYARRKLEEMRSPSSSDPEAAVVSPVSGRFSSIEAKEPRHQQDPSQQPGVSRFQEFSPIPQASPAVSSLGPSAVFSPTSQVYWKDRFLMLQRFLNQCDQSSQEEYIQSKPPLRRGLQLPLVIQTLTSLSYDVITSASIYVSRRPQQARGGPGEEGDSSSAGGR